MAEKGVAMKKYAVLWCAAIALILSAGSGFAAALNAGGMHGERAQQRQGFERHRFERRHGPGRFEHRRFERRHEPGRFEHRRFERRHESGRSRHFDRHSGVIIGGPLFGPPIFYSPPLHAEPKPPVYVVIEPGVNYSYYCTDPGGYYPAIQNCPTGWLLVIPGTPPD